MKLNDEVLEMKKEVQEIKEYNLATEILHDYKKTNKRQFIIVLVILTMWFITIGYLVYLLNDIGTETVTTETSEQEISDIDSIQNSNIINGDNYGEDKTNKNKDSN